MIVWGVTAQNHDASLAVVQNSDILFASSSERFSRIKNDKHLNFELLKEALKYGSPDVVVYYENPWKKKLRQLINFDFSYFFDIDCLPKNYLRKFNIKTKIEYIDHHLSHALSGYNTSTFDDALVVVIDSLGEFKTCSIYKAVNNELKEIYSIYFPHSLGLLYSSFTKRCGLKPNEEEYILMGMAAYGNPIYKEKIREDFIDDKEIFKLKSYCTYGIDKNYLSDTKIEDIAASIQSLTEECILKIILYGKKLYNCDNLVYMGGVALNCVANSNLLKYFKKVWIMPNPGDSGSCIGAASYIVGKLNWSGPCLGFNIKEELDVDNICKRLQSGDFVGIAHGRAEFGPRALGNRSIIADPTFPNIKDKLDSIKLREKFRPFAPAVLEEEAHNYFDISIDNSPYMQYVFKCKDTDKFKAICHVDGTSRIQTVSQSDNIIFYNLIKEYYKRTGCPMLLNTSLNVKGKPIVNKIDDKKEFNIFI